MYVTRPLSWYKRFPAELEESPTAEGPNSEKHSSVTNLNNISKVTVWVTDFILPTTHNLRILVTYTNNLRFIHPPFRHSVIFYGKSVASDGIPSSFLSNFEAVTFTSNPRDFTLSEARGLDIELRTRLPEFNFPLSCKNSEPVVVGKWYCPFIFIKDGKPKDQMKKSMYYDMKLEQRWERVFACDSIAGNIEDNVAVVIDIVTVEREVFRVGGNGNEAILNYGRIVVDDGVMWFKSCSKEGNEVGIGLSLAIFERMKWEQERFGWSSSGEKRIKRVEKFEKQGIWKKFGCYILVERFVLRRMDGSLA